MVIGLNPTMEEPEEQCTVVFALVVTEPISVCVSREGVLHLPPTPPAGFVTIYAKRKDDSALFSRFLYVSDKIMN